MFLACLFISKSYHHSKDIQYISLLKWHWVDQLQHYVTFKRQILDFATDRLLERECCFAGAKRLDLISQAKHKIWTCINLKYKTLLCGWNWTAFGSRVLVSAARQVFDPGGKKPKQRGTYKHKEGWETKSGEEIRIKREVDHRKELRWDWAVRWREVWMFAVKASARLAC